MGQYFGTLTAVECLTSRIKLQARFNGEPDAITIKAVVN